jgi:hypothetical protein
MREAASRPPSLMNAVAAFVIAVSLVATWAFLCAD